MKVFCALAATQPMHMITSITSLLKRINDTLEVGSLQRSATNQTTVDVGLSKQLRSVASLAATTVKDSSVVGYSLTVLLSSLRLNTEPSSSAFTTSFCLPASRSSSDSPMQKMTFRSFF